MTEVKKNKVQVRYRIDNGRYCAYFVNSPVVVQCDDLEEMKSDCSKLFAAYLHYLKALTEDGGGLEFTDETNESYALPEIMKVSDPLLVDKIQSLTGRQRAFFDTFMKVLKDELLSLSYSTIAEVVAEDFDKKSALITESVEEYCSKRNITPDYLVEFHRRTSL